MRTTTRKSFGEATRRVASFCLLAALMFMAGPGTTTAVRAAEPADSTLTLTGTVTDTLGRPQGSVTVRIEKSDQGALTDSLGSYRISGVPRRNWTLRIEKTGFYSMAMPIPATGSGIRRINASLRPKPTAPMLEGTPRSIKQAIDLEPLSRNPLQLVESSPIETSLEHLSIPNAWSVWPRLIQRAERSIDLAQFYVSDDPTGRRTDLSRTLNALRAAAVRGVKIRLVAEERFHKTYPQWLDSLATVPNIEVRRLDSAAFNGGVLHAKYFIVDGRISYIGSQNFDWRSLEHIQELGVAVADSVFTAGLQAIFEYDWTLAGLVPPGKYAAGAAVGTADSLLAARALRPDNAFEIGVPPDAPSDTLRYRLVGSPVTRLPNRAGWDLTPILTMIEQARDSVSVQLLTYKTTDRSGEKWTALDDALRLAAGRGVRVRLLVSNWCKRKGTVEGLQELSQVPNVEVRFMNIPEWSGGFIPFARTTHAKYMVVDGRRFWIGTSNWEKDYFFSSRNVGVVGEGRAMGRQLAGFFRTGWDSPYAEPVKAGVAYTPPRVSE